MFSHMVFSLDAMVLLSNRFKCISLFLWLVDCVLKLRGMFRLETSGFVAYDVCAMGVCTTARNLAAGAVLTITIHSFKYWLLSLKAWRSNEALVCPLLVTRMPVHLVRFFSKLQMEGSQPSVRASALASFSRFSVVPGRHSFMTGPGKLPPSLRQRTLASTARAVSAANAHSTAKPTAMASPEFEVLAMPEFVDPSDKRPVTLHV